MTFPDMFVVYNTSVVNNTRTHPLTVRFCLSLLSGFSMRRPGMFVGQNSAYRSGILSGQSGEALRLMIRYHVCFRFTELPPIL